jgi:2-hydroxycyclohexanecarboxyl-CoA dehydrogenase
MNLQLSGQTVAVVGAARGIGRAMVTAFHAEGCRVVGFDRAGPELALPAGVEWVTGDATLADDVARFVAACDETDHLVFCVGAGSGKAGFPFWNLSPADWPRVLELNLVSAVLAAHAFAPNFARRRRGSLLFLVSVAGQVGSPTDPPYSAAKAGLINFVHCAARDFASYGVRVNALSPGMVKTELNQSVWEAVQRTLPPAERRDYASWAEDKIRRISPLGRWQTAEECAALAAFLASDHARSITGQTLNVDGGQVMHA